MLFGINSEKRTTMIERYKLTRTPISVICQVSLLVQGLSLIPTLAVLGGDADAIAQTPADAIDEFGETDVAPPPVTAPSAPEYSTRAKDLQPLPEPEYATVEPAPEPAPEPEYAAVEPAPEPEIATPDPLDTTAVTPWQPKSTPETTAIAEPDPIADYAAEIAPPETAQTPETANAPASVRTAQESNLYVDPTEYNIEAADNLPPVVSESAIAAPPPPPVEIERAANDVPPANPAPAAIEQHVYAEEVQQPASIQEAQRSNLYSQPLPPAAPPVAEASYRQPEPVYYAEPEQSYASLPPAPARNPTLYPGESPKANIDGIHYRTKTAARNFDLKRLGRETLRRANGNISMIFPLAIPAEITSLFGWRTHPIFGDSRFHSGTDIGAPMGTPAIASYAGTVAIADWLGGYGQTVVLHHHDGTLETLYAHLSEILVAPGEQVQQGQIIGRVGSTGNSTGPHLHFELRELTPEGWVTMDPGTQLEYALSELLQALEVAPEIAAPEPAGESPLATLPSLDMPAPPPPVAYLQAPSTMGTTAANLLDVPVPPPLPAPPTPVTMEVSIPATVEPPVSR